MHDFQEKNRGVYVYRIFCIESNVLVFASISIVSFIFRSLVLLEKKDNNMHESNNV